MISAFIGQETTLRSIASAICHTHIAVLPQGYFLLPILVEVLDACSFSGNFPEEYPEFSGLFPELIAIAHQHADPLPLAYVETDYFGGVGTQAAILWDGNHIYGPFQSNTRYEQGELHAVPAGERPINQVLQRLGVQRGTAFDEFDALGLGRFRSNEAWITSGNPSILPAG